MIPGDDKTAADTAKAMDGLTAMLRNFMPPAERREFDAFLRMLDDDHPRVTMLKSAACGKTEMMLNDLAAAVGRAK